MATKKGNNAYLAERKRAFKWFLETGIEFGWQQKWDFLCLVLNSPEIMGKNVFGKARLLKIRKALDELDELYRPAFSAHKEADYYQEKLDSRLRAIFGDDIAPFKERYPYIKQLDYSKPHKQWKDLF